MSLLYSTPLLLHKRYIIAWLRTQASEMNQFIEMNCPKNQFVEKNLFYPLLKAMEYR